MSIFCEFIKDQKYLEIDEKSFLEFIIVFLNVMIFKKVND